MGGVFYRGRGKGEVTRSVPFLFSVSSPYDQRSIEKQLHNVLLRAREEEEASSLPSPNAFGLAASQSTITGWGAPLFFHLPPLWSRVGGEKLEGLGSSNPGKQRPAGSQASKQLFHPFRVLDSLLLPPGFLFRPSSVVLIAYVRT